MCVGVLAGSPLPTLDVARLDGPVGSAAARPRPAAVAVAVPVPPEVRVGGETVAAVDADVRQSAHGAAAVPESVVEAVLGVREPDQVRAAHAVGAERDAVGAGLGAGVDDEGRALVGRRAGERGRAGHHPEGRRAERQPQGDGEAEQPPSHHVTHTAASTAAARSR